MINTSIFSYSQGQLPNGQLLGYGMPPGRLFPGTLPPMGQAPPGPPMPGSAGAQGFPGAFPSHNAAPQVSEPNCHNLFSLKYSAMLILHQEVFMWLTFIKNKILYHTITLQCNSSFKIHPVCKASFTFVISFVW